MWRSFSNPLHHLDYKTMFLFQGSGGAPRRYWHFSIWELFSYVQNSIRKDTYFFIIIHTHTHTRHKDTKTDRSGKFGVKEKIT